MVLRKRVSDLFLALIAASAAMTPTASMAGDWRNHRHHDRDVPSFSGDGLPSVIPGLGTFVGGISAVRIRGVGNYFYIEPNVASGIVQQQLRPKAKVVETGKNAGCSMENGVCVIRP
jgi:hypothetical protein